MEAADVTKYGITHLLPVLGKNIPLLKTQETTLSEVVCTFYSDLFLFVHICLIVMVLEFSAARYHYYYYIIYFLNYNKFLYCMIFLSTICTNRGYYVHYYKFTELISLYT